MGVNIRYSPLANCVADIIVTKAMMPVKVVKSIVIAPSDGILGPLAPSKRNGVNNIANKNNNLFHI